MKINRRQCLSGLGALSIAPMMGMSSLSETPKLKEEEFDFLKQIKEIRKEFKRRYGRLLDGGFHNFSNGNCSGKRFSDYGREVYQFHLMNSITTENNLNGKTYYNKFDYSVKVMYSSKDFYNEYIVPLDNSENAHKFDYNKMISNNTRFILFFQYKNYINAISYDSGVFVADKHF